MATASYLVKTEPSTYAFEDLVREKRTSWDGVRNYEARNTLRAMKRGDEVLVYHSGKVRAVVGLAKVVRSAYQDPTTTDDFSAVDLAPVRPLARPVSLAEIKANKKLAALKLVTHSRLSVMPTTKAEFDEIVRLSLK